MSERDELTEAQAQRARRLLDEGAGELDAHTVQRLQRARAAALRGEAPVRRGELPLPGDEMPVPGGAGAVRAYRPVWLLPAAGFAVAASLVLAVVTLRPTAPERAAPDVATVEDIEILFAKDDLDLYEDLEFYAWLEEQPG
jgi:hypothetical protein